MTTISCSHPHSVSGPWIGITITVASKPSHLVKDRIIPEFIDRPIILLLLCSLFVLKRCLPLSLPPWTLLVQHDESQQHSTGISGGLETERFAQTDLLKDNVTVEESEVTQVCSAQCCAPLPPFIRKAQNR